MALYRLWPRPRRALGELSGRRPFLVALAAELAFAGLLCVPVVSRATGIAWPVALALMAIVIAGSAINNLWLAPRSRRARRWFHVQVAFDLVHQVSSPLLFVAASGDPRSPIWAGHILVACIAGAYQELDPSWTFFGVFLTAPLALVPVFLRGGADPLHAWTSPLVVGALGAIAYHVLAGFAASARALRDEQERTIDELRRRMSQAERDRLARDLHDAVGSTLSLVALYADLIERSVHDPAALERVARTQREATAAGLRELRGLLDAMSPAHADAAGLRDNLERIATRAADAAGVEVSVQLDGRPEVVLEGAVRLAAVRIFQEALANAIRHGEARRIDVRVSVGEHAIELHIRDDGRGFSPPEIAAGRGLPGMRARAAELGGRCDIDAAPGRGTKVLLSLPLVLA